MRKELVLTCLALSDRKWDICDTVFFVCFAFVCLFLVFWVCLFICCVMVGLFIYLQQRHCLLDLVLRNWANFILAPIRYWIEGQKDFPPVLFVFLFVLVFVFELEDNKFSTSFPVCVHFMSKLEQAATNLPGFAGQSFENGHLENIFRERWTNLLDNKEDCKKATFETNLVNIKVLIAILSPCPMLLILSMRLLLF